MQDKYTAQVIGEALGVSRQRAETKAKKDGWPYEEKASPGRGGKCRLYLFTSLPSDVQRALAAYEAGAKPEHLPAAAADQNRVQMLLARFEAAPAWSRQRAEIRLAILKAAEAFIAWSGMANGLAEREFSERYCRCEAPGVALDAYREEKTLSPSTIRRWRGDYKRDGLAGLLSEHGTSAGTQPSVSPEARILLLAHLAENPHIRPAKLLELAEGELKDAAPSRASVYRFAKKFKKDNPELYALIEDPRKWKNSYLAAFGDAAHDVTHFCHTWEADSTKNDVITADGKRCAVIMTIDVYSGRKKIVVAPVTRSLAVAACLRKCFLDWGVVKRLRTDNGKDYTSRHITAILTAFGIEQKLGRKYQGQDKPFVERGLQTYLHDLVELLPGYCGHSVGERQALREKAVWAAKIMEPGADAAEIPFTLAEMQLFADRWVIRDETKPRKKFGGRSPLEVSQTSPRQPEAITNPRVLDILLAPVATPTVGKKGITLDSGHYTAPELVDFIGCKVEVRRDLLDAGTIYVFTKADGKLRYVCTAEDKALAGLKLEAYLAARKAKDRQLKEKVRALRTLSETVEDPLTVLLPTGELKPPKVVGLRPETKAPGVLEARKALEKPEAPLGLAQEMDLTPEPSLPENVVRGPFARETAPDPEPACDTDRPYFEKSIDAWDWLCEQEAMRRLTPDEEEWKETLLINFGPQIQAILRLRNDNEGRANLKRSF